MLSNWRNFAIAAICCLQVMVDATASADDANDYPDIEKAFQDWGDDYHWKSYDCTTTDGYDLTMFRIVGDASKQKVANQWSKGVVLLLPGFSKDAYTWFDHRRGDMDEPFLPTTLFNEGYDVWQANIRGTRYSITHNRWDSQDDSQRYFNYDFSKIATKDIPCMVEKIMETQSEQKEVTSIPCKKISMIGHSHGAAQILAALSYTVKSDRYVSQVIAMEPCLIAKPDSFNQELTNDVYNQLSFGASILGIHSLFGPDWPNQLDLMCQAVGEDSEECVGLRTVDYAGTDLITADNPWSQGEIGTIHMKHMAQNYLYDDFQEYSRWWPFWRNTRDFKMRKISRNIPVKAIWSDQDELCPQGDQLEFWNKIRNRPMQVNLDGDHGYQVGRQDAAFMTELRALLDGDDNEPVVSGNCDENYGWF